MEREERKRDEACTSGDCQIEMKRKLQHCYLYEIVYENENDQILNVHGRCWGYTHSSAKEHAKKMFRKRISSEYGISMIKVGRITSVFHLGLN